jgi:hypothetical protein
MPASCVDRRDLLFAATLIAWLVATALLYRTQFTDWMFTFNPPARAAFESLGRFAGALLYVLGCGTLAAAIVLRRGRKWASWFAVILFLVNICGDVMGAKRFRRRHRTVVFGCAVSASGEVVLPKLIAPPISISLESPELL